MPYWLRRKHLWALLLAAVLGSWLYSQLTLIRWQQHLHTMLQTSHTNVALIAPNASSQLQPQASAEPETLLLSDISLPPPNLDIMPGQPNHDLGEKLSAKPTADSAVGAQPVASASPGKSQTPQPGAHNDARQIYQQLQNDKALNIQLALPTNSAQHTLLLDYLYRCAATQFAVLQSGQGSQQLQYLSPKRYVTPSQWLRVVNGPLSAQEQKWLARQPGQAVRVFAHELDQRLAKHIASSLSNTPLQSLRASYRLKPEGLYLSDIELNGQALNSNWLLHARQCPGSE